MPLIGVVALATWSSYLRPWIGVTAACVTWSGSALLTLLRVIVLIALASLIWVPVGVWIGLRPALARRASAARAVSRRVPGQPLFSGRRRR